jgi:type IV pilus assembly protein PilB
VPADLQAEPGTSGQLSEVDRHAELEQARRLADRYRLEFVDMDTFRIDQDLFRSIPADLMLRYGFVPYRRVGKTLEIVVSDPTDLPMIDELGVLLATPIKVAVGPRCAIESILKKSESSQRVLRRRPKLPPAVAERGGQRESLTVERLTNDIGPVVRLVIPIYTAIQRRASDIHTRPDDAVHVKWIDGVLRPACGRLPNSFTARSSRGSR